MRAVIVGGAGFVGLNIAEAMLAAGHDVTVFDRAAVPAAATAAFAGLPGRFAAVQADVDDTAAVAATLAGANLLVWGAAITADAARDAAEPARILAVNLAALVPVLEAAQAAGIGRIINLSSAAAYGYAPAHAGPLSEDAPVDPVSLYAVTKFASERVAARLADLWAVDLVNLRLSAAWGPWERSGGVRDTPSPQAQIMQAAAAGRPALLARPGARDWVYAPDVAAAVLTVATAASLPHRLYNVTTPRVSTALAFGERIAAGRPGFVCRLVRDGEAPTIDLHAPKDREPLAPDRLATDLGWRSPGDFDGAVAAYAGWWERHGGAMMEDA